MGFRISFLLLVLSATLTGCDGRTKQQLDEERRRQQHAAEQKAEQEAALQIDELPVEERAALVKRGTIAQRRAAAAALAHLPNILDALKEQDEMVRHNALKALSAHLRTIRPSPPPKEALAALKDALKDPAAVVRLAAFDTMALHSIDDEAFLPLILASLPLPVARVRASAAGALCGYPKHGAQAIPALRQALQDADAEVRKSAIFTLGRFGKEASIAETEVILALRDPADQVRWEAAIVIPKIQRDPGKVASALIAAFRTEQKTQNRMVLAQSLGQYGEASADTVPLLIRCFEDQRENEEVRVACANALGGMRTQAKKVVPALHKAMKDENDRISGEAMRLLSLFGPEAKEALPHIIAALDKRPVKTNAVLAVMHFGPIASDAAPALIKILKESKRDRDPIIVALGRIGPAARDAVPILLEIRRRQLADNNFDIPPEELVDVNALENAVRVIDRTALPVP